MEQIDLLLTRGVVVTQDDARRIIQDGAIAIRGDRIVDTGPSVELSERYEPARLIDVDGSAIFPGLINTHTHLFQVSVKGLGEDMPVHIWASVVTAPTSIHIRPDEAYACCLTGGLEQIRSGVTTQIDMSYAAQTYAMHEANIQAMIDSGLRSRYSSAVTDWGEEIGVLPGIIKPIDAFLDEYRTLLRQYPPTDRLGVWVSIGSPWTISDEALHRVRKFADSTGTPLILHLLENNVDNVVFQQRHGTNIVPYLDQTGFLGPDLLCVHCVKVDDRDIELMAKHDVKVSYNPVSNMYLGSGIPPMLRMAAAGLTISIGIDGAGSNNSQDMIETLKFAALLQKVGACDASVISAQTVLDWATRGAAKVLGLADQIGSLEAGKQADLFVLSPRSAKIVAVHDPVTSLVYSAGEGDVVTTIAGGVVLLHDGMIQHVNEAAILARAQEAATAVADRCGSNKRVTRPWRPLEPAHS
jgi:5-methylthioadenosine/S-adenosylhomocysteine deaminase